MDRSENHSPTGSRSRDTGGGGSRRNSLYITAALEQLVASKDEDAAAFLSTARQDAKRQEYETSMLNYSRAAQHLTKRAGTIAQLDALLSLARTLLEAGEVGLQAKSLDFAEAALRESNAAYLRCADQMDDSTVVLREFVECVKGWASAAATRSQSQQHSDRRAYVDATRKAFQLYDWALRLIDPSGTDVSTTVLGCLSSLGQLAAQLQCFDWALELFERNQSIKEIQGIDTDSVRKHIDRVTDKIAQFQNSREAMRAARFREESERLFLDEFRQRMELIWIVNKTTMRFVRSIPPPPSRRVRSRPSSGDSAVNNFFKTGNFTGLSPQQEVDAFRADVEEGKSLVKTKQLEDAQDHLTAAVELAASSFSIPPEEYRGALGSLAYVYCMRAQTENERGSKEYRKMMMRSVPHYKKVVEMTEERIAQRQSNLQEEVSLASTYLQLGVVAVSLDRQETGLFYMRKARSLREKFRMDTTQEDRHIVTVEKSVRKHDAELLAHASQLAEARKQTVGITERPHFQQCVAWYNTAKALMQQRQCDDAEPILLQALVGFEALMGADPSIRKRPEYRLTLTGLGATYYFLGQAHSRKTSAFAVNNEQALAYYNQSLQAVLADATSDGSDDVTIASLLFHVACCYANMRRYDVASVHFSKSRDMKQRVGLTVEDIDVNLDALTQRLVSLIDEDVIRQQQQLVHRNSGGGSGSGPSSSSAPSSNNSSTTTTPREMNLSSSGNFDSPKSLRRSRAVSFLLPSDIGEADSMESSVAEFPSSPVIRSESPKLHQTGSILMEQTYASPKIGGDDGRSPSPFSLGFPTTVAEQSHQAPPFSLTSPSTAAPVAPPQLQQQRDRQQRDSAVAAAAALRQEATMEELAKDIAADLWVPAQRAIAFIAQEERRDRAELFARLDQAWRGMVAAGQRDGFFAIAHLFLLGKETHVRRRVALDAQKQWLVLAQQRIAGAEQIARNKIVLEHRRVVTVPQSDSHDALAHNQEALARFKLVFLQRVHFFHIIEQHHRERHIIAELQYRRERLMLPKIIDAAMVSKGVMFNGARKLLRSHLKTWILQGETIDRFAVLHHENYDATMQRIRCATGVLAIEETAARSLFLHREMAARLQQLGEAFHRNHIEVQQRHAARIMLRFPMLREELMARERIARRETLVKPEALMFLGGILQPVLEMHQWHVRRMVDREWQRGAVRSVALPVVQLNEKVARSKLHQLHSTQTQVVLQQAVTKLESTHRKDIILGWVHEVLHRFAVTYLVEQEALTRNVFLDRDYRRVFDGIVNFERQKKRESVEEAERSRRRVLRMLSEECCTALLVQLEQSIRGAIASEQQRVHQTSRFLLDQEHLILRESLLRRVGERLAADHRLKHVMSVMAPHALQAQFVQVSARKMRSVEAHFRQVLASLATRSVGQLTRQGLQVLAVASALDLGKREAMERFQAVETPFLAHSEHLARLDQSYRHREILNLMFVDHRKGVLAAVEAAETRQRRVHNAEAQITYDERCVTEMQLRLTANEAAGRRMLHEQWQRTMEIGIRDPMAQDHLGNVERVARRRVQVDADGAFMHGIQLPYAHAVHGMGLAQCALEAVDATEAACRGVEEAMEFDARRAAAHSLDQLHGRCAMEREEQHTRSLITEYCKASYDALYVAWGESFNNGQAAALLRTEATARPDLLVEEAVARMEGHSEAAARAALGIDEAAEARALLVYAGMHPVAIVADEAHARTTLVARLYEDQVLHVLHPAELASHQLMLDETTVRLSIVEHMVAQGAQLQDRFFQSGRLVTIQLHEMVARQGVVSDADTKLGVLQQVAFEEQQDASGRRPEALGRAGVAKSEATTRATLAGVYALETLTMSEDAAFHALVYEHQTTFVRLLEAQCVEVLMYDQLVAWSTLVASAVLEAHSIAYADTAATIIESSEAVLRIGIDALYDQDTVGVLTHPYEKLLTELHEASARHAVAVEEAAFAQLLEEEVHISGARLEQRRVATVEDAGRMDLCVAYLLAQEALERQCFEDVVLPAAQSQWFYALEAVHRSCIQHDELINHRLEMTRDGLLFHHASHEHQLLPIHAMGVAELSHRMSIVAIEAAEVRDQQATWEAMGSTIMLLLREATARQGLEAWGYVDAVQHPLQRLCLTAVDVYASVEASVYAVEHEARSCLLQSVLGDEEAVSRQRLTDACATEQALLFSVCAGGRAHLVDECSEWAAIVECSHTSMRQHVAALLWAEALTRRIQVDEWCIAQQWTDAVTALTGAVVEGQLAVLLADQEPAHRTHLVEAEEYRMRLALGQQRIEAEEVLVRQPLDGMLVVHALQLEEFAWRCSCLDAYHEGVFRIRFGPILDQLSRGRLALEVAMAMERCELEKDIIYRNFLAVQQLIVMTEFTMRRETIARIQLLVLVERKEWSRLMVSWNDACGTASTVGGAGAAAIRRRGSHALLLRGAFAPRGVMQLPPLAHVAAKDPTAKDDGRGIGKPRKHLGAIASAEENLIREALNIRPGSASSAAGTPRNTAAGSGEWRPPASPNQRSANGRAFLKPLPSAMVTFKRSHNAEAAAAHVMELLHQDLQRTTTLESFQRFVVEEQTGKAFLHVAGLCLVDRFVALGDAMMLEVLETLSVALFDDMSECFGLLA